MAARRQAARVSACRTRSASFLTRASTSLGLVPATAHAMSERPSSPSSTTNEFNQLHQCNEAPPNTSTLCYTSYKVWVSLHA